MCIHVAFVIMSKNPFILVVLQTQHPGIICVYYVWIQERERGQRGVDNMQCMHYLIFSPRQAIHSNGNLVRMTLGCNPKYPATKAGCLYSASLRRIETTLRPSANFGKSEDFL